MARATLLTRAIDVLTAAAFLMWMAVFFAVSDRSPMESAHAAEPNHPLADSQSDGRSQRSPPSSGDTESTAVRDRRNQAQAELDVIRESGRSETRSAGHADRDEIAERQALLEQIVRGYDEQLSNIERLAEARERHADIVRGGSEWKGLPEPPPYSIILADQIRDGVRTLKLAAEGLQSQRELLKLRFEQSRDALTAAEGQMRQASERLEATQNKSQLLDARRQYELVTLRIRAASVLLEAAQLATKRVEEELNVTNARLALEERKLEAVLPHVIFSETDLERIRTRLNQERLRLEMRLEQTLSERQRLSQVVQNAEQRLDLLRRKQPPGKDATPAMVRANAEVELAQARKDNLATQGDLLQQLMNVVEGERQLWESRFVVAHASEPGKARQAYERFAPLFEHFHSFRDYLRQQAGIVSGQISELESRMSHTPAPRRAMLHDLIRTFHDREEAYTRTLHRMDEAARFMERWRADFKFQQKVLPLSERLHEWFTHVETLMKDAWAYELFSAEDTIEVDGKTITGRRGVTVGKTITALAIFLIGYAVCMYIARIIGRLSASRFGMTGEVANLVRQWSQAFLVTALILLSFTWAKIPLTIFAFLGGAFAIGVGFGAQTLLKNVISGILVLIERPMRVGDFIEADNVRGRVTSIGLRSSTIRDAKGMETLIPNSSFLERPLTNWTYSSHVGRFSLRVGAPYGTAARQIVDLLSAVAIQHPKVMKQPPPQVLLEEFGAQTRIFTVNYWHEISPDVDPSGIASELRFAIEQTFADAGVKIVPAA